MREVPTTTTTTPHEHITTTPTITITIIITTTQRHETHNRTAPSPLPHPSRRFVTDQANRLATRPDRIVWVAGFKECLLVIVTLVHPWPQTHTADNRAVCISTINKFALKKKSLKSEPIFN
jgi:hypothetical protein